MAELMLSQGSLRELAEQTGGIASVNTNSLTNTFNHIVQANSRYYVLGYYPPTHPRDGRFHKIEVKTSGRACASQARRDTARRAAGQPKSASATKRPGARAKRSGPTPTRRPRSCARSSPAR